jgi:hypothetical protein
MRMTRTRPLPYLFLISTQYLPFHRRIRWARIAAVWPNHQQRSCHWASFAWANGGLDCLDEFDEPDRSRGQVAGAIFGNPCRRFHQPVSADFRGDRPQLPR